MRALIIFSGGLDSTVLAYKCKTVAHETHLLSFNYGQRHVRELECAERLANDMNANSWRVINLSGLGAHLESALTSDIAVPDGHYAEESMRATVVPNRNAIMLSIATGVCWTHKYDTLAFGAHSGDHYVYPDCRPQFIGALNAAVRLAGEGFLDPSFCIIAPFGGMTKADIVLEGHRLGVPFADTWSCYKGGEIHCGACGTCVERREAFLLAGVDDPTEYASLPALQAPSRPAGDYWRPQTA